MNILAFFLLFVVGAFGAACGGDWSGMKALGSLLMFVFTMILMGAMILNPELLILMVAVIGILVLIVACVQNKNN